MATSKPRPDYPTFFRIGGIISRNEASAGINHPNFPATPSGSDVAEMVRLVEDAEVGAVFAVLLIMRLTLFRRLVGSATVFTRFQEPAPAKLIWERRVRLWRG